MLGTTQVAARKKMLYGRSIIIQNEWNINRNVDTTFYK
jgi:hypothetical protein